MAVGATEGFVYIRSEYPDAIDVLERALIVAAARGLARRRRAGHVVAASTSRCGSGAGCLHLRRGDRDAREPRGQARRWCAPKPPLPAIEGLFGKPTVVNNVTHARQRAGHPGRRCRRLPRPRRRTVPRHPGVPARRQRRARRDRRDAVRRDPRRARRGLRWRHRAPVARSAPSRSVVRSAPTCARSLRPADGLRGLRRGRARWSVTAASSSSTTPSTWPRQARFAMEFCAEESCGKCTPCRIGSVRGVEVIDRIVAGEDRDGQRRACSRTSAR